MQLVRQRNDEAKHMVCHRRDMRLPRVGHRNVALHQFRNLQQPVDPRAGTVNPLQRLGGQEDVPRRPPVVDLRIRRLSNPIRILHRLHELDIRKSQPHLSNEHIRRLSRTDPGRHRFHDYLHMSRTPPRIVRQVYHSQAQSVSRCPRSRLLDRHLDLRSYPRVGFGPQRVDQHRLCRGAPNHP